MGITSSLTRQTILYRFRQAPLFIAYTTLLDGLFQYFSPKNHEIDFDFPKLIFPKCEIKLWNLSSQQQFFFRPSLDFVNSNTSLYHKKYLKRFDFIPAATEQKKC